MGEEPVAEESPHVDFQSSRLGGQWRPTVFSKSNLWRGGTSAEKGGDVMLKVRAQKATLWTKKQC
ncbi:hypothetical protein ACQP3J_31090, partial [Escherichia coli]